MLKTLPSTRTLTVWGALVPMVWTLSACSTIKPEPLTAAELRPTAQQALQAAKQPEAPIQGPLTLDEAVARALKYNLDRRTRLMEEALALGQLDVTQFDMLPKLLASAGYSTRSNDRISQSRNAEDGHLSPSRFISQERSHSLVGLDFSWSLLDVVTGHSNAKQQADRALIASERRRKAMHLLMQDVRTAYWRAASAQRLRADVERTLKLAEEALSDSRQVETERLRNPLDSLRYQRQLLENLRLLESIDQELSAAQVELAALIHTPLGQPLRLADDEVPLPPETLAQVDISQLEELALDHNADVREQHFNARIAREETRKVMARLFPNLSFSTGLKYDSDSYLVNQSWQEAGLQISFNLLNFVTAPVQRKLVEAGVALADQRRLTTQMAVLAQVRLARLQVVNARSQFLRADAIFAADQRIAEHVRNRESASQQSKLDRVGNDTAAILSLLRRYQALAQVQAAESRLIAQLGLEPRLDSTDEMSLEQLVKALRAHGSPLAGLSSKALAQPQSP